ncbi:MAG: Rrf2 family transcriptional regulator [Bacteroidetes bacterium]|nr:Rrf2 family transcriptional regulator [Bacteroidota bacterium]MBT5529791.1 Rrf2 family transcriptional regulator [Cytophagia bacterium]MBT3422560.1 Rrf2 family transcriptional regulator [Bacteroidota bacterium]MBT3800494.1 Rrf2 family transcriptional regulator [Bacteroidota bacterium]MBT3934185.1 Rrf2 family transcriptional regulator [Bacteroidota bacterium]
MSKLINISEASTIAIHSLALISNSEKPLKAHEIAGRLGFSIHHVPKVLQILVKYNYLNSVRGPRGGFTLKKEADSINLLEIHELIDGELETDHCGHNKEDCPFDICVYGSVREEMLEKFKQFFSNKKLSDINKKTE